MATDKEIKQMHKAKVQRWDNQSIGAMVGGLMHDAVAIAVPKLLKEKASLNTKEDYQKEVEFWLDWLIQLSQEKKDYLSIPVVEGEPELVPIEEPMPEVKQWDSKKREIESNIGDLKVEENQSKNIPF